MALAAVIGLLALFLPSGTMCNEIALRLHVRPGGDEVILDVEAVTEDDADVIAGRLREELTR